MPNGLSDGAVIIDTGLNNSKFFTEAKAWKAALQSMKQTAQRIGAAMGKSGNAYSKAIGAQTRAAVDLDRQIKRVQTRYAEVVREMNAIQKTGGSMSRYNELSQEAKSLSSKLSELRGARGELGGVSQSLEQVGRSAGNARRNIVSMIAGGAWNYLKKLASGAKNAAIQLAKLAGRAVTNGLKKVGQLAAGAAKSILHLGRGARKSGNGFQFSLKNMLKYGLGIRSLFVLFNRLRSAIKEGFGELANYDPRVKAALASLKGALGGLKGSLSAAFAPILTAVAPALTTFINLVTKAVNAIGMFFAALTGQGYYYAAKGIEAVGSGAKSSSGSVKELNRQLAGFDELNVLSGKNGGGSVSGSGSDSGFAFEKQDVAGGIADFVKALKDQFENGDFTGIGKTIAEKLNGAIDSAKNLISWDNLGGTITKALNAITGTVNGFTWNFDWSGLGNAIGAGVNTVTNSLLLFFGGIDWTSIGQGIGNSINGLIDGIDWTNLGRLFSEKAKALIDVLKGALTTIEWGNAGTSFAQTLNGFFEDESLWADAGKTVNAAINGILDFTKDFLINLDVKQIARDLKALLGNIDWTGIWEKVKTDAKLAFDKLGGFLDELFGDDKATDTFKTGKKSWVYKLGEAIGKAIGDIDWPAILEAGKQAFLDAFDGLLSGLFDSENGDVALKIAAAIAGIKLSPTLLKGALLKMFAGSGVGGAGVEAAVGGAAGGISGGLAGLIGGGLNLAGLYGFGKSAVVNGKTLYDIVKEWVDEGHGSFWDLLKGSVHDLFSEDDGKGITEHLRETINTLFDPLKPEGNYLKSVVDKLFPSGKDSLFDTDSESLGDKIFSALGIPIGGNDGKGRNYERGKNGDDSNRNDGRSNWLSVDDGKGRNYGRGKKINGGIHWDYSVLSPELQAGFVNTLDKNTDANKTLRGEIKKNTDANESNTKQIKNSGTGSLLGKLANSEKSLTWDVNVGLAKRSLGNLSVDADVNYKPAGATTGYLNKPLAWLQKLFAPGTDTQTRVELVKKIASQTPASLFGTAFDAVANLVKKNPNASSGALFGTAFNTFASLFKSNSNASSGGLFGTAFNTFASLYKSNANASSGNLFGTAFNAFASLLKSNANANTASLFGTAFTALASLAKKNANATTGGLFGTEFTSFTELKKKAGSTVYVAAKNGRFALYQSEFETTTDLNKSELSVASPADLFGTNFESFSTLTKKIASQTTAKLFGDEFTAKAELKIDANQTIQNLASAIGLVLRKKAEGGIITAAGRSLRFAVGGMISGGGRANWWNSARKYAAGTSRAHGTVFVAGEAGPEIMGHVNGRTEILNKSQLAQTMYSAVTGGMIAALRGITFTVPAMATGGIMPYEVSAQIARTGEDIRNTLNANNEDLIQTIISVAGQLVAAVGRIQNNQTGAGGLTAQQVINEINRQTLMFGASPLKGV